MASSSEVKTGNGILDDANSLFDSLFNVLDRGVNVYSSFTGAQTAADLNRIQAQTQAASASPLSLSMASKNNAITLLTYGALGLVLIGGMIYMTKHV